MNKKLTQKLLNKYPKLFIQHKLPITESAMGWLFQCNDGWYWLINMLCSQLQFDIDRNNEPQLEFTTIKEKFGNLRLYHQGASERQDGMIDLISFMSNYTCEDCGSTSNVTKTKGYITTLCSKCMIDYKKKREVKK